MEKSDDGKYISSCIRRVMSDECGVRAIAVGSHVMWSPFPASDALASDVTSTTTSPRTPSCIPLSLLISIEGLKDTLRPDWILL